MSECFVYVIGREKGPVKIGISSQPYARLREIQTGCPFKVELLYQRSGGQRHEAMRHENLIHLYFTECGARLQGEWFKIDAEEAVNEIDSQFSVDDHFRQRAQAGEFA